MKLSILILSINSRASLLNRLLSELKSQIDSNNCHNQVEILTLIDNGEESIGSKRNTLKNTAKGKYICFIDDDDLVPEYYIKEILCHLDKDLDLINFLVEQFVDGVFKKIICPNVQIDYLETKEVFFWNNMLHLCPHKKEIANKVKFLHINNWEDLEYSKQLKKYCNRTYRIDKVMYKYYYNNK